ncbi:hypothetical protein THII_2268 [Thioploca ingrica]|uniref:Uncharacterized protein n=1 Tax=Thioploca ingrica TaxID=40754 RepID=A0A090AMN8_9GAMM|nr:hypothetical protein THII_2268 [Thioploca ingrica]
MTIQLLEKAIAEVSKRSATEQDIIAMLILEELADEQKWQITFADSADKLAKLAKRVQNDIKAGRVRKMGFDEL